MELSWILTVLLFYRMLSCGIGFFRLDKVRRLLQSRSGTNDDPGSNDDPGNGGDMISTAEQYIGQSLDALEGACGSPQGSSYEDDPETGKTGFHYYSNFTVSTTVDENGNEIGAGIW